MNLKDLTLTVTFQKKWMNRSMGYKKIDTVMGTTSILNDTTSVTSIEPLDAKNTLAEELNKEEDPVAVEKSMEPLNHTEIKELDASKMIEIMKESTKQLDQILIKMCQEKGGNVDTESNTLEEEQKTQISSLHDQFQRQKQSKSLHFYEEIINSFSSIKDKQISIPAISLVDLNMETEKISSVSVFSSDCVFVLNAFEQMSRSINGTKDKQQHVRYEEMLQALKSEIHATDHILSPSQVETLAVKVLSTLTQVLSTETIKNAVAYVFPHDNCAWFMGNSVCKIRTKTEERDQQWGMSVYLNLHAIVRPKDNDSQALGPRIDVIFSQVFFLSKEKTTPCINVSDYHIDLVLNDTNTKSNKENTSTIITSSTTATQREIDPLLPEFIDVYQIDNHSRKTKNQYKVTKLNFESPFPRNRIVQAACSCFHTLLLNDVGAVFSFGIGTDGALGHGTAFDQKEPKLMDFFCGSMSTTTTTAKTSDIIRIVGVSCGGDEAVGAHSAAVAEDGRVFTWGVGPALGIGATRNEFTPKQVDCRVNDEQVLFKFVVCGSGFCMALTKEKSDLYTWGKYANGRLGLGNIPILHRLSRRQGGRKQFQQFQLVPKRIEAFDSQIVHKIVCGDHHTLALVSDRVEEHKYQLFTWGKNASGQLGCGRFLQDTFVPQQVETQEMNHQLLSNESNSRHWTDIAAGSDWSLALDTNGHVWTWGALGRSVLGHSGGFCSTDDTTEEATQLLLDQALKNWKELSMQENTTDVKQLNNQEKHTLPRFSWMFPRKVEILCESRVSIRSIAAGQDHAIAISTQGDLYAWGNKSSLTDEEEEVDETKTFKATTLPTLVTRASHGEMGDQIAESVFCGGDKTIVITGGKFLSHSMKEMYTLFMENAIKNTSSNQEEDEQQENAQALGYCDMSTASDTELIVAGRSLYAHKMILARRSPVLRDLIFNEQRTGHVVEILLPSVRYDVAKLLLEFIYTDNVSLPLDPQSYLIRDLLRAAELYQLPKLKRICKQLIKESQRSMDSQLTLAGLLEDDMEEEEEHDLAMDLNHAFSDPIWSDVTFIVEEKEIYAHKSMLIARSDYFRAMFNTNHPMQESTKRVFHVEESYLGMLRVLHFIYSDRVSITTTRNDEVEEEEEQDDDSLLEDLIAADKYGLVRMKRICEHMIHVNMENCLDALVVADLVGANYLKQNALLFIKNHLSTTTNDLSFQRLQMDFPHLLEELYTLLLKGNQDRLLLQDWSKNLRQQITIKRQEKQQQAELEKSNKKFPYIPMLLAILSGLLYTYMMHTIPDEYPIIPALNAGLLVILLVAGLFGII